MKDCIVIKLKQTECTTDDCRGESIEPSISKDTPEIKLGDDLSWIFVIESVTCLLPMSLEQSKQTSLEADICGWCGEDNHLIILRKLNPTRLKMRAVTIE